MFPKPRHRAIDVIASSLILWNPFGLEKLLDLSIPQFYLAMMPNQGVNDITDETTINERSW